MKTFPIQVKFNKTWRPYQQRVLEELEGHLDDNCLHIIAAPGSGKTVLGLEVARRLNKPTLIFAPTLSIRDQWVDRFKDLFCEGLDISEWVSKDIKNPKFLTVSTYQGLHSAFSGKQEVSEEDEEGNDDDIDQEESSERTSAKDKEVILQKLKGVDIKTIVVDEAHHLRSEWWKCLIALKESFENPIIVALTATPPYDSSPFEWERYKELCGPVDSEIPVPELVKERNLCPHQDYVYFSTPLEKEKAQIKKFRNDVKDFFDRICQNTLFAEMISYHPCIVEPHLHIEEILKDPGFFSSIVIFLNHIKRPFLPKVFTILGIPKKKIPSLDLETLEELMTGCLYSHQKEFSVADQVLDDILKELKRCGAIERRKVQLRHPKMISKQLVTSMSKLQSIVDIVQLESNSLKQDLRMVVLTDFIRQADLPKNTNDEQEIKRMGVVPIFEQIRRAKIENIKLGVLSGSFVVIPKESQELVEQVALKIGIDPQHLKIVPLVHTDQFVELRAIGEDQKMIVKLVTRLFNKGGITVLVGTKSLLGEGWDAPSINALILASFVGSYMLSNQMRGRAIRTQEGNPNKTSNIWHLVCVEENQKELSDDLEMLTRRFKAFVGVSFVEQMIENGIGRLGISDPPFKGHDVRRINSEMREAALDRDGLRDKWYEILDLGDDHVRMVEELAAPEFLLPRPFVFGNTIFALFWQSILWGAYWALDVLRAAGRSSGNSNFLVILMVAAAVFFVVSLPGCIKALYLFLKHGPIASSIKQIGEALLKTLIHIEVIKTPLSKMKVCAQKHKEGFVVCNLEGGTTYEKSLFLDALQEILSPIENPRYILIRKNPLGRLVRQDYHPVPNVIGRKKEFVEFFSKMWSKHVGPTKLIYTRTLEGRMLLLKARGQSLATSFQKRSERVKAWK